MKKTMIEVDAYLDFLRIQIKQLNELESQCREQIYQYQLQKRVVRSIILSIKAGTTKVTVAPEPENNLLKFPLDEN